MDVQNVLCFVFAVFSPPFPFKSFRGHLASLENLFSSLLAGIRWPTNRAHTLT